MNQDRLLLWFRKALVLTLSITLCLGLLSACSITDILSKSTELIDQLSKIPTDASGSVDTPLFPEFPSIFTDPTLPDQSSGDSAPVTEPSAESVTAPAFSTDPEDIRYGIAKSDSIPLYEDPSQASSQINTLVYGDRVPIYGTDKGWVYTSGGWALQDSFYIEGDAGENPIGSTTVTGTDVNLRGGPGRDHPVLRQHNTGDQLYILEEFYDDDLWWGYTGDGWICMDYIYVNGTMSENCGTGTVTGDVVNIRQGPGTQYSIVGTVKEGQVLQIYNYITVKGVRWCCIDRGWVCMDYVRFAHS